MSRSEKPISGTGEASASGSSSRNSGPRGRPAFSTCQRALRRVRPKALSAPTSASMRCSSRFRPLRSTKSWSETKGARSRSSSMREAAAERSPRT